MRLLRCVLVALSCALALSGCGGGEVSPERAAAAVETSRAEVQQAVRDVVGTAGGLGLVMSEVTGSWSVCSADPPRLKYRAGGAAPAGDVPAAERIEELTSALEAAGWVVDRAGTDPEPYATLTRDDLRASLGESRRTPGSVSIGVTGPCVDTTPDQDSLLSERDFVVG